MGTRYRTVLLTLRTPKIRLWPCKTTIYFTICLFISPDLDGHRAPGPERLETLSTPFTICFKKPSVSIHDMFHDMFVHESGLRRV